MCRTSTIAGAETFRDYLRARLPERFGIPQALQWLLSFFDHDVLDARVLKQIVNMPVSLLSSPPMPRQTLFQSAQCASGINVIASRKHKRSQLPYRELRRIGEAQMKLIDAGHHLTTSQTIEPAGSPAAPRKRGG